ncbi:MAG: rod shape-determining protein [Christensenellaceae bacterium]|jgi:cell division protein FtsA|nr:rod shape-determining protein [Christensenellaceae bacterium]
MGQNTAILDVGSSKIICLICSTDGKGGIVVRGAGICEYEGYKAGAFLDEQHFADAIIDALNMAETEAKLRVRTLSVGVPAAFLKLVLHDGHAAPVGRNGRVTPATVDALINDSLRFEQPEGYALIHSTPIEFHLSGAANGMPDMPLGQATNDLSAPVSHVFVCERFKGLVSGALHRLGLDADMYIGVPLSAGSFIIPEPERQDCAALIDVGAQNTDVSLLRASALIACESIPVGGAHFTNDLVYALKLPPAVAEGVKRRYVYSLDYQDSIDTIRIPGGGMLRVEHAVVQYILEERTRELAELIKATILEMGVPLSNTLPVYLTGGGVSLMRGSCEFLEKEIGIPIKVRMPWMPRLSSPNYASAFSVMDFVTHADDDDNAGRLEGAVFSSGIFKKLRGFFVNK